MVENALGLRELPQQQDLCATISQQLVGQRPHLAMFLIAAFRALARAHASYTSLKAFAILFETARLFAMAAFVMTARVRSARLKRDLRAKRGRISVDRRGTQGKLTDRSHLMLVRSTVQPGTTGRGHHLSSVTSIALRRLSLFSGLLWQLWQLQPRQYCPEAKHSQ